MSAYSHDRRDFIKLALAASSFSFVPGLGLAFGAEEDRTSCIATRNLECSFTGTLFARQRRSLLADHEANWPAASRKRSTGSPQAIQSS